MYHINKSGTQNVVDAKNLFDALRTQQAIQAPNTVRQKIGRVTVRDAAGSKRKAVPWWAIRPGE